MVLAAGGLFILVNILMLNKTPEDNPRDEDGFAGQWRQMWSALKARMTTAVLMMSL